MDNNISITMFGGFRIENNGVPIMTSLRQAPKTRALIEYLIFKSSTPVSQEELIEALWEKGTGGANPHAALRTMLHRFRTLAEESGAPELRNAIVTERGAYRWSETAKVAVDLTRFEELGRKVSTPIMTNHERERYLKEIIALYTGPLLPEQNEDKWITIRSISCHDLFLNSVFSYIEILRKEERYQEITEVCRSAMSIDVFDEKLHTELVDALVHLGKNKEALAQYYSSSELMMEKFGSKPSAQSREVFREIAMSDLRSMEQVDEIAGSLSGYARPKMLYDYSVLREIVFQQHRVLGDAYFSMITLELNERVTDPFKLQDIRSTLEKAVFDCIDESATFTRYNTRMYLIVLVEKDLDETEKTAAKIAAKFSESTGSDVGIKTRCRLLFEPAAPEEAPEPEPAEE